MAQASVLTWIARVMQSDGRLWRSNRNDNSRSSPLATRRAVPVAPVAGAADAEDDTTSPADPHPRLQAGYRTRLTPEKLNAMRLLLQSGTPKAAVARQLGVSERSVYRAAELLNVNERSH
jgi:hypothetical protein